jgi:hypothetical protein
MVTIGKGVTTIGANAFSSCSQLLTIYIKGNAPSLGTGVFPTGINAKVYYRSVTTGWTSTYGGFPTVELGLPIITMQSHSIIANSGENAAFNVIAVTSFPLTISYQWQRNGLNIPGANSDSIYINNIQSANVGSYTVIISNDVGSISSTATLTITPSALYTQAQYDSALQAGLNAGMAFGRSQVTDSPNAYGLYSLSQIQALNVNTPLLSMDPVSRKFKLTIEVEKSANLTNFTPVPISAGAAKINAQGKLELEFASSDNAAFYRLQSK